MKRVILLLVLAAVMGFAVTASAEKDVCWNFNNPFGTDTIRALFESGDAVIASWIIQLPGGPLLIPMVGTLQKDLDGRLRLSLHGTARDLSLNSPFIFDCFLDATLDKNTFNSKQIAPTGGNPFDLHSSVLAGCTDYFEPDNPFTSNDTLTKVSCNNFPNPKLK